MRTEGPFGYEYANDLIWTGRPGVFALVSHDYTLGLQALLTGESKGNDTLKGVKTNDTAITALYVGPGLTYTLYVIDRDGVVRLVEAGYTPDRLPAIEGVVEGLLGAAAQP